MCVCTNVEKSIIKEAEVERKHTGELGPPPYVQHKLAVASLLRVGRIISFVTVKPSALITMPTHKDRSAVVHGIVIGLLAYLVGVADTGNKMTIMFGLKALEAH